MLVMLGLVSLLVRLSSVWPINFQQHSQAAAASYSYVGCQNGGTFHGCTTVQFKKAESSVVLEFMVVGH